MLFIYKHGSRTWKVTWINRFENWQHKNDCLIPYPVSGFLLSYLAFLHSNMIPGITFQIIYLQLNPQPRVCFWGNSNPDRNCLKVNRSWRKNGTSFLGAWLWKQGNQYGLPQDSVGIAFKKGKELILCARRKELVVKEHWRGPGKNSVIFCEVEKFSAQREWWQRKGEVGFSVVDEGLKTTDFWWYQSKCLHDFCHQSSAIREQKWRKWRQE